MGKDQARDLEADLALCEAATPGPWKTHQDGVYYPAGYAICEFPYRGYEVDANFVAAAREGWPYAIRRALELEAMNDRLREEISLMQEQLQQHRSLCYD